MIRVLLVEDDTVSRKALTAILSACGCDVTPAENLAGGISALDNGFDAIVTDLMLPDGSGVDLLQAVQERHLPATLLVTTAATDERLLLAVNAMTAGRVFVKPIAISALLRSLGL